MHHRAPQCGLDPGAVQRYLYELRAENQDPFLAKDSVLCTRFDSKVQVEFLVLLNGVDAQVALEQGSSKPQSLHSDLTTRKTQGQCDARYN